jgi:hypothetical protein
MLSRALEHEDGAAQGRVLFQQRALGQVLPRAESGRMRACSPPRLSAGKDRNQPSRMQVKPYASMVAQVLGAGEIST